MGRVLERCEDAEMQYIMKVVGSRLDYTNAELYGLSNVFNASKMHWLGVSLTLKFIRVQMCCYNYTGCRSISALTSNLRSLLAHLPPVCTRTHQLPDICQPVRFALKILAGSLFPGRRQSLVRAYFASLRRPRPITFLKT